MNPEPCIEMEAWLVDYADGTLTPEESERVAGHIERCAGCRKTVDALCDSIQVAGDVWQDALQDVEAIQVPATKRVHAWGRQYAVAAGIMLAIGGAFFWSLQTTRAPAPLTLAEMERQIAESGTAARLLAATGVLMEQAIEPDMVQAQYGHIVEQYPNTDAAAQVRLKLESIK
jgi:hypothetical protein